MIRNELKTIPEFPNYAITKNGRVWSKPRTDRRGENWKGRWLKIRTHSSTGYICTKLRIEGLEFFRLVHRLVLETYIGSCPEGMECRHLNGLLTDNRLENLIWGTRSENMQDAIRHKTHVCLRRGSYCNSSKLTEVKVKVIRYLHKIFKFSYVDLAWQFDMSKTAVRNICTNMTWKH